MMAHTMLGNTIITQMVVLNQSVFTEYKFPKLISLHLFTKLYIVCFTRAAPHSSAQNALCPLHIMEDPDGSMVKTMRCTVRDLEVTVSNPRWVELAVYI